MSAPRIRGIVAVDPELAIGRGGTLPWHYPEDLRFFKETTLGQIVLMGRKTFESIGRPLPGRRNIVLSRSGFEDPGVTTISSIEEIDEVIGNDERDLYLLGGAAIYEALAGLVEEWVVTRIPERAEGADTFLPASIFDGFRVTHRRELGEGLVVEYLSRDQER